MKINILVKQAGKKNMLTQFPFEISSDNLTLNDLISSIVLKNVALYNNKKTDSNIVDILTNEKIEQQIYTGKVGFNRRYNNKDTDPIKACETAIQAFEDGLFRVFIDEEEACDLDGNLNIHKDSQVLFIRFTFLAGRMW